MNPRTDRRGMTLVELLIVTVLGGLVLAAIYQVLVTNQRTFAAQNAHVQGQQTLRGGMSILYGELRELSPEDGDIISMGSQGLDVRVSRSAGIVCSVLTGGNNPTVQAKKLGRYLRGDSARVFYENDPGTRDDDDWRTARIQVVDSTGTLNCPDGETAQELRLRGIRFGGPPDSIHTGALVRNFVHYEYDLDAYNGEPYLIRTGPGGTSSPLVGPLSSGDGVTFRFLDGSGSVTTVPADVRQIEVTLRITSESQSPQGGPIQDSLTTRVFTRNTTN